MVAPPAVEPDDVDGTDVEARRAHAAEWREIAPEDHTNRDRDDGAKPRRLAMTQIRR
jgi:hypothetical protein